VAFALYEHNTRSTGRRIARCSLSSNNHTKLFRKKAVEMNTTIGALSALATSVPDWIKRLDDLNGQIAQRQVELAQLETRPPPPRSMRNKGSTESLRPKDRDENPFLSDEPEETATSPKQTQDELHSAPRQRSPTAQARAAGVTTPPPPKANSNPRPSPNALTRTSSQPTPPPQPRPSGPAVLRKRKTESLASGESLVPKYRTRSMIIVYYDSAVQTAFEELVKFVSGSRNAMRKGKMAAKMAEMRRAAELEVELDGDENDESSGEQDTIMNGRSVAEKGLTVDSSIPNLRFVSTRQLGVGRGFSIPKPAHSGSMVGLGMLRGYRRSGGDEGIGDVFSELDKALEWCQSECEKAAHQFLRDGECDNEINNIKRKLSEVRAGAEKELEQQLKLEETEIITPSFTRSSHDVGKVRELKSVMMRRGDSGQVKDLEIDESVNMEVDEDEGVDDMEPPPLIFKRSRDA
jgi:hypothetical protein